MINMPSSITETGDILLHAKSGLRVPVSFQADDGTPRDMSGTTVNFYVEGGPTIAMTPGSTADELVLVIPKGIYNALLNKRVEFALVEDTSVPSALLWSGLMTVTGFA